MKLWLSADIGCLECGEGSAFVLFDNEADAKTHSHDAATKQADEWHGQHSFSVEELEVQPGTPEPRVEEPRPSVPCMADESSCFDPDCLKHHAGGRGGYDDFPDEQDDDEFGEITRSGHD